MVFEAHSFAVTREVFEKYHKGVYPDIPYNIISTAQDADGVEYLDIIEH
jgi:hypothetical protein